MKGSQWLNMSQSFFIFLDGQSLLPYRAPRWSFNTGTSSTFLLKQYKDVSERILCVLQSCMAYHFRMWKWKGERKMRKWTTALFIFMPPNRSSRVAWANYKGSSIPIIQIPLFLFLFTLSTIDSFDVSPLKCAISRPHPCAHFHLCFWRRWILSPSSFPRSLH